MHGCTYAYNLLIVAGTNRCTFCSLVYERALTSVVPGRAVLLAAVLLAAVLDSRHV